MKEILLFVSICRPLSHTRTLDFEKRGVTITVCFLGAIEAREETF